MVFFVVLLCVFGVMFLVVVVKRKVKLFVVILLLFVKKNVKIMVFVVLNDDVSVLLV